MRSDEVPNGGKKERRACGYEAEEEDDDQRVLVVHEVVAQAGGTIGDAAIGEGEVEFSECGRDVDEEEAVEEAYGRVPGNVRAENASMEGYRYLKAGSRPKKATKVTRDTVMVKMMMVRATVMVKETSRLRHYAWRNTE